MNPPQTPIEIIESPASSQTDIAVKIAVLTEKVHQVIGDHERRITNLEQRRDGASVRGASIIAPFIAGVALVVLVADKIRWN